ncbi:putative Translocon-associated protein beta (TRAPB) [Monocercomonoides exilis]|uniref:putative Translocon-associated protein beta (TRAPB) n=1 Tax=Monocercomonoides exilis TaxID=2049356 RepID=UPI00355A922D|nr:putative Translocon-associated protein beta (TRAPB) [Monocercomonoides exilis]|eukprot:MONOS_6109.1-p1 / transcript=MONOS_6109.1 / gene=MONOS_6109 / organism=Monocercomonoides_exilis_PA203 / gene_product=unspecified product / transcript_product=unspecified product / location=Mono_scaffold00188:40057-40684(-) / protein_length=189 / sequence_SO=supercontig / SO=protein_coding / is_pseudo=false
MTFFIGFLVLLSSVFSTPTVLVKKELVTLPAGEKFDLKTHIHIHNAGEEPIYDVNVDDQWGEYFLVSQNAKDNNLCHYDKIEGETNVTCEQVWVPQRSGAYHMLPVRVSYREVADSDEIQFVIGHPFIEAPLDILPQAVYKRFYTSHKREFFAFLLMSCNAVLIPYIFYTTTHHENKRSKKIRQSTNSK